MMRRPLAWGGGIGAALGLLFALAVISIADCLGPSCARERAVGLLGLTLAGATGGVIVAGVLATIWRWARGRR